MTQVIANIPIVKNAVTLVRRVFDRQHDGNSRATAGVEDLAAFFARLFTGRALVTAQVVHIQVVTIINEAVSQPF